MKKTSKKGMGGKPQRVPRVVSIGRIDFDYTLTLPEDYLLSIGVDIETVSKAEDLAFLKDNKDLWDRIVLSSNNGLVNMLVYLNKVTTNKTFIEMTLFNSFSFAEKDSFLKELVNYVTEHNYLFIIEANVINCENKISFTLKSGKRSKSISLFDESVKTEKESTEEFSFSKVDIDFAEFDYFLIDFEEFFSLGERSLSILEDFRRFVERRVLPHKNLKIAFNYPDMIKNFQNLNLDTIGLIEDFLSYGDFFIFEKTDASALFSMLGQIKEGGQPTEVGVYKYLVQDARYARAGNKVVLLMEDLQKCSMIEFNSKTHRIFYQNEFDLQLHPRINHFNQKLVEEYKKLILIYGPLLKSVFLGGLLSKAIVAESTVSSELYAGFLTGTECAKRILELMKNNLELPLEHEFYMVKIAKAKIQKEIEREELKRREQKFVLDCINKQNSHLKFYNPLFDDHLNSFFASEVIRHQLKEKGFINTNGFIMYDPKYRSVMGASPRRKKINEMEKEKQLLYAIKSINVSEDKDKSNFDSYSKMLNSNSPTNRKLPTVHFEYTLNNKFSTKNTKRKLKPIEKRKILNLFFS
jgi:hypothetical protein